ncbi:hypothetical protein Hanom_Chr11g01007771 [Helianthus anomalus]
MMNYAFCCVLNMIRVSLFCMENWCPSLRLAFFTTCLVSFCLRIPFYCLICE